MRTYLEILQADRAKLLNPATAQDTFTRWRSIESPYSRAKINTIEELVALYDRAIDDEIFLHSHAQTENSKVGRAADESTNEEA